jgi:hypothetical protein
MSDMKFRAIIKEKNVTHYFTLQDLARDDSFTMRAIVRPWLAAGNLPDRYTGLKGKNDKEIYEGDILYHNIFIEDEWFAVKIPDLFLNLAGGWYRLAPDPDIQKLARRMEVIGNICEHPALLNATK